MKKTLNAFWIISAVFLALGALWGVVSGLENVMSTGNVCGIALIVFGVISILAYFTAGIKASGSGWLLFDGVTSFFCGLSYIFSYVDYALFNVSLTYIMGLWLMFLGISQIARSNSISKSFGRGLMIATGVLGILGGLALYVRPVSDLLLISETMELCGYSLTFQLLVAALIVISRLAAREPSRRK